MTKKTGKTELEKRLEAELAAAEAAREAEAPPEGAKAVPIEETVPAPPLAGQLAAVTAERDQLKDQMLRLRADFDNFRKRTARETERIRTTAAEDLIRDLLPVVDNLERALEHAGEPSEALAQGVEMVLKQLCDILAARGVEPIPAEGAPFDPNVHEALSQQPSDRHPADAVMTEWMRGYRIGDTVLRPAKVVVSSGPAEAAPAGEDSSSGVQDEEQQSPAATEDVTG